MKKIILLVFILISVNMFSKNKVTVKLDQEGVYVAMNIISKQTGMEFAYNPQVINTKQTISVDIVDKDIEKAIALLFDDVYTCTIKGKYIIISEKKTTLKHTYNQVVTNKIKKESKKNSGTSIDDCLSIRKDRKPVLEKLELEKMPLITNYNKNTIMLKEVASMIALFALTTMPIDAQTIDLKSITPEESNPNLEKSLVHFSFAYPLSTDGFNAKNKEYKFSLNMLGGITGGINGVEIGGLFNINKQNVRGVQIAGLFNATGGANKGLQMGGIFNSAKISRGAQIGGVFNYTQELSTAQIAGIMNYTKGSSKLQIAGVLNHASDVATQISILNIAKKSKFQMGLVNISGTDEGAMLGLFNYVKKGGLLEIGLSSNDYIYGAVNLVTGTDRLYSILSFGIHSSSVSLGAGVGTRIQMGSSPSGIHLELLHNNLFRNNFKNTKTNASLEQLKVLYSQRKNKFTFYGGPTFNVLLKDVGFESAKEPLYNIFKDKGSKHDLYSWIGAEIGVRFNLK